MTPEMKGASTDCTDRTTTDIIWNKQQFAKPTHQRNSFKTLSHLHDSSERKSLTNKSKFISISDDGGRTNEVSSLFTDQISDSNYMAFASKIQ